MNLYYQRVIPRDFFNEAKLLKCMGRICLLIHDNLTPVKMSFRDSGEPFLIALMDEGSLTVTNVNIRVKDRSFTFKTTYNSKSEYPFYVQFKDVDYLVFDEEGNWNIEFLKFCANTKNFK